MAFERGAFSLDNPAVHRVIRTEFFFDKRQFVVLSDYKERTTLSAAWLGTNVKGDEPFGFQGIFRGHEARSARRDFEVAVWLEALLRLQDADEAHLADFIDSRLHEHADGLPLAARIPVPIRDILDQPIVIERSPPIAEKLVSLAHSATSTSLGVLLGTGVSPDPYVMMLTVPVGILLMGTVLGITKGLERGLAARVENAIAPKKRTPRPPKDKG
jgi:hypothetical protein